MQNSHRLIFATVLFLVPISQAAIDIYSPSLPNIMKNLQTTESNVQLTISLFLVALGLGQYLYGAGDLLTTGTMYAYDGEDRIYFQVNATGRINYYDIAKNYIYPFSTVPYGMGTAILSNRMEIVETSDGLQYLYVMRHSAAEMWRCLIYF